MLVRNFVFILWMILLTGALANQTEGHTSEHHTLKGHVTKAYYYGDEVGLKREHGTEIAVKRLLGGGAWTGNAKTDKKINKAISIFKETVFRIMAINKMVQVRFTKIKDSLEN